LDVGNPGNDGYDKKGNPIQVVSTTVTQLPTSTIVQQTTKQGNATTQAQSTSMASSNKSGNTTTTSVIPVPVPAGYRVPDQGGLAQDNTLFALLAGALGLRSLASEGIAAAAEEEGLLQEGDSYLYQKVGPYGEHLKYGITKNPATRYTAEELGGGRLRLLASGERSEMLGLERDLHKTLPIGPEEGQSSYIGIQGRSGYSVPPYNW